MTKSEEAKQLAARQLRCKRPALADMDYGELVETLWAIQEDCYEIRDMVADDEKLIAALDGDEEEAYEFQMAFADVEGSCDQLIGAIEERQRDLREDEVEREYNDCTVALVGELYKLVGYDSYEEDYYGLTSWDREYAEEESGKRLMRKTKAEMLNTIGYNMRLFLGYQNLKQQYEHLKATIEIVKGTNQTLIDQLREIEAAYEEAERASSGFKYNWYNEVKAYNRLLEKVPDQFWVE